MLKIMTETRMDKQINDIFQMLLHSIKENTNSRLFDNIFGDDSFELKSLEGNKAIFVTDASSTAKIIKDNYLSLIQSSLNEITQSDYEVEITDRSSYLKKKTAVEAASHTFFKNSHLQPQYTFDNFVTGPSNKEAYLASLLAVEKPGRNNPIFIYSKSGLGKTHLLQSIGNEFLIKHPEYKVLYITSEDFVSEFVKFIKGNKNSEDLKDFFSTIDILLVDDIQFLTGKDETQVMFFHVFNLLIAANKQIVLTSDRSPSELKGLQDRLVSRFSGGLSINITNPEKETLIGILKMKIKANNLSLSMFDNEVLEYLAFNYSRNVRELEGAFTRLLFSMTIRKPEDKINLKFVKSVFEDDEKRKTKAGKIDIDKIVSVVASSYSLTESQLKSKVRTRQIALARQIAMYLSRTILNSPYQVIGRVFGKDHTTVLSNVSKIEKESKENPSLRKALDNLTNQIKATE